ncbi:MAG: hypothetical protein COA52_19145 [Hyphomicrobiales bacterium]|nr:MAG: hypothetical protein COA52_19145 [Hyphomicrobiales bacterium]
MNTRDKDCSPSAALKAHLRHQRARRTIDPDRAAQLLRLPTRRAARPVPKIGRKVLGIVRPLVRGNGASFNELAMRWPELAGTRLMRICALEKMSRSRDGTVLHIVARGGAGAALVELESNALIARINAAFGRNFISRLRIRQGRIGAPIAKPGTSRPQHGPSPADLSALEEKLNRLPEGPLRLSARQLGLALLARNVQSD